MTQPEYEQKRRECWEEFCKEHPLDATANGGVAFRYAFDRAYALGKQTETISQEEIEKAAQERVDNILYDYRMEDMFRDDLRVDMINLFKDAIDFALGKQEKDAEETLTCDKSKVLYHFRMAEACKTGNNPESDYWIGYSKAIQELFGLKGEPMVEPVADTVIQGWVARDKGRFLGLYPWQPKRGDMAWLCGSCLALPINTFPDLTWESDPEPVEIIIKRKKNV